MPVRNHATGGWPAPPRAGATSCRNSPASRADAYRSAGSRQPASSSAVRASAAAPSCSMVIASVIVMVGQHGDRRRSPIVPIRDRRPTMRGRTTSCGGSAASRQLVEPAPHDVDHLPVLALEVVAAAGHEVVRHWAGDRRRPLLQLVRRPERVGRPMDEEARHGDRREVLDAQVRRLARRVQRIADQHDADELRRRGLAVSGAGDHRADPTAHRPTADDDAVIVDGGQLGPHRGEQLRRAVRRPPTLLAVVEVRPHGGPRRAEARLEGDQRRLVAARTGAREQQEVAHPGQVDAAASVRILRASASSNTAVDAIA